jgi:hypothetical protein
VRGWWGVGRKRARAHRKPKPIGASVRSSPRAMAEPEELEFRVTYPGGPRDSAGDEFVFVYEEEKRPLVVLLGWAGCQDRVRRGSDTGHDSLPSTCPGVFQHAAVRISGGGGGRSIFNDGRNSLRSRHVQCRTFARGVPPSAFSPASLTYSAVIILFAGRRGIPGSRYSPFPFNSTWFFYRLN